MRLLRRLWRMLNGRCVTCDRKLTDLELMLNSWFCLGCEVEVESRIQQRLKGVKK